MKKIFLLAVFTCSFLYPMSYDCRNLLPIVIERKVSPENQGTYFVGWCDGK